MTLTLEPETGIPLEDNPLPVDLKDRVEAAANTAKDLEKHGLNLKPNKEIKQFFSKTELSRWYMKTKNILSFHKLPYSCLSAKKIYFNEEKS